MLWKTWGIDQIIKAGNLATCQQTLYCCSSRFPYFSPIFLSPLSAFLQFSSLLFFTSPLLLVQCLHVLYFLPFSILFSALCLPPSSLHALPGFSAVIIPSCSFLLPSTSCFEHRFPFASHLLITSFFSVILIAFHFLHLLSLMLKFLSVSFSFKHLPSAAPHLSLLHLFI